MPKANYRSTAPTDDRTRAAPDRSEERAKNEKIMKRILKDHRETFDRLAKM